MPSNPDQAVTGYVNGLAEPLRAVAASLQTIIDGAVSSAEGRVWQGHPVWLIGKQPVVGFKAFPRYVTVMFWKVADTSGGSPGFELVAGPRMSTVKVAAVDQLDDAAIVTWVQRAEGLAAG